GPGQRVLDVGCGMGDPTLQVAVLVGPHGRVLGIDVAEGMIATARERAAALGLAHVEFRTADVMTMDLPADSFDAVLGRWSLIYVSDPPAALARLRGALVSAGRIALSAWAPPEANPWITIPMAALARVRALPPPDPAVPGAFHLSAGPPALIRGRMHGPAAEPPAGPNLPLGVVTFLMTDVESSTRLWRESAEAAALIARQTELIAAAVARHGGVRPLEQGEGDSTVAAFARASDALAAALEAQRALAGEPWPESARVRVRMAVHTGEAELRGAARDRSAGDDHGCGRGRKDAAGARGGRGPGRPVRRRRGLGGAGAPVGRRAGGGDGRRRLRRARGGGRGRDRPAGSRARREPDAGRARQLRAPPGGLCARRGGADAGRAGR